MISPHIIQRIVVIAVFSFITACGPPDPVLKYSLNTPPLMLVPTGMVGVADGRGRFREILCAIQEDHGSQLPHDRACADVLHRLSGEPTPTGQPVHLGQARSNMRILVVAGTMAECFESVLSALPYAREHLEEHGYTTGTIPVGGRTSSTHNATQIRDYLLALEDPPSEKIVLIGYSKGAVDILEAVANHPEVADRVTAVVSYGGAVSGSPLADDLPAWQETLVTKMPWLSCPVGDAGTINSLRRETRLAWLAEHTLPNSVRYFSLVAFADRDGISAMLRDGYDKLATIDPRNDSQVIFTDAIIPSGTLLGYAQADHWAIAMPVTIDLPGTAATLITRNAFPREVLLEAIIRFVEESLILSHEG
jgi:pimeloyl-ACP methyl ester carboxylesterase